MSIISLNNTYLYDRHPEPWDQLLRPHSSEVSINRKNSKDYSTRIEVGDICEHERLINPKDLHNHRIIITAPASVNNSLRSVNEISNKKQPVGILRHATTAPTIKKTESNLLKSCQKQLEWRLSADANHERDIPGAKQWSRYRQSRQSTRRIRKRVLFKNGDCNVVQSNVAKRKRRYLQDIFTTLVDAQWRWTLLVFSLNFLLSWLGFAMIWWIISVAHGDLLPEHLPGVSSNWTPCITNINSFMSCFLFSIETQHTIGYGGRTTTEECPEAIFVMCLQSITGVFIDAFMVGIIFAKLSRPKKRTQTLLFSRNSVICHRDGQPCLLFRVGDMRKSHIIEAHIRAQLIRHKITREGEQLPFYQQELKVGFDGNEDRIFFIWPTTIVHVIDQTSPLYKLSATDLLQERFEIVVILEGVIESTGMTTQARSSYLPSEILWGHRFVPVVKFKRDLGEYEVDYELFNNTVEVDTPLCSAKTLDDHREANYLNPENEYGGVDHLTPGLFNLRSPSSDTLDISCCDSVSLDERIIITPPSSKNSIDMPIIMKLDNHKYANDDQPLTMKIDSRKSTLKNHTESFKKEKKNSKSDKPIDTIINMKLDNSLDVPIAVGLETNDEKNMKNVVNVT